MSKINSTKAKITTRALVTMALLSAISVVLARLIIPMPNVTTRFSIEAVPIILAGHLFGPLSGAIVGFVADFVGCLFSGYGYNPAFSVSPILIGLCAGLLRPLLYRRVSYLRVLASFLPAVVLGSLLWQSYWLSFFYGGRTFLSLGSEKRPQEAAARLFAALRELDERGDTVALCEAVDTAGIGLAVMNRMGRAAAFDIEQV